MSKPPEQVASDQFLGLPTEYTEYNDHFEHRFRSGISYLPPTEARKPTEFPMPPKSHSQMLVLPGEFDILDATHIRVCNMSTWAGLELHRRVKDEEEQVSIFLNQDGVAKGVLPDELFTEMPLLARIRPVVTNRRCGSVSYVVERFDIRRHVSKLRHVKYIYESTHSPEDTRELRGQDTSGLCFFVEGTHGDTTVNIGNDPFSDRILRQPPKWVTTPDLFQLWNAHQI